LLAAATVASAEFAEWHREAIGLICANRRTVCVGWAAKMVNVYLKAAVYVGGLGSIQLMPLLHPPLDGGLFRGLRRRFRRHPNVLSEINAFSVITAVSDYPTYERIIGGCRLAAAVEGCLLIELEQFWDLYGSASRACAGRVLC